MIAPPRKPRRRLPCDEVEVPVARTNGHAGSANKAAKGTDAERDSLVQVDVTHCRLSIGRPRRWKPRPRRPRRTSGDSLIAWPSGKCCHA